MLIDVVEAKYVRDFVVWLKFEDGSEGEVDLSTELYGPVFEPLKDLSYFSQVAVDPEMGTIAWPNGADFAPEFLYDKIHVHAGENYQPRLANRRLTRRRSWRGPASVRRPSRLAQRYVGGVTPPASRASHASRRRAALP